MDRNLTHDEEGVGVGVGVRNYVETLCILNLVSFYVLAFTLTKSFMKFIKEKLACKES